MLRFKWMILLSLLLIVGGWYVLRPQVWQGDEGQVRQILSQLKESCEVDHALNIAEISVRLNQISPLFSADVAISATDDQRVFSSLGWQTIKDNFLLGSRLFMVLELDLDNISITVIENSAMADFVIHAIGKDMRGVEFSEQVDAHIEFENDEGQWRISKVDVERVLH